MSVNIKKGDTVRVIAGKDKGAEGKVISVLREESRVIVEGVNRVKKHTKVVNQGGRAGNTGGIITTEAPIHVSNVMLIEGKGTTRVGFKRVKPRGRVKMPGPVDPARLLVLELANGAFEGIKGAVRPDWAAAS